MIATEHELNVVSHGLLDDPFWERVMTGMETAISLWGVDVTRVVLEEYAAGYALDVRRLLTRRRNGASSSRSTRRRETPE